MKRIVIKKTAVTFMLVFALGLSFTAANVFADYHGQETEQAEEAPEAHLGGEGETVEISDANIQLFAKAQGEIMQLEQKFASQFAQATEPAEQQAIMEQANEEMMAVIEGLGMELNFFNQMALQIQSDPQLQEKLNQALQEQRMQ